jgi:hypothetical protein
MGKLVIQWRVHTSFFITPLHLKIGVHKAGRRFYSLFKSEETTFSVSSFCTQRTSFGCGGLCEPTLSNDWVQCTFPTHAPRSSFAPPYSWFYHQCTSHSDVVSDGLCPPSVRLYIGRFFFCMLSTKKGVKTIEDKYFALCGFVSGSS